MTKTIDCVFFKRDGYCVKEHYCTFSHNIQNSRKVGKPKVSGTSSTGDILTSNSSATAKFTPKETHQLSFGEVDDLWDHLSVDRNIATPQGVYYYGAPGKMSAATVNRAKAPYAAIARSTANNFDSDHISDMFENISLQRTTTAPPCRFYILGTCRFGASCKNSHVIENSSEVAKVANMNGDNGVQALDSTIECGICISVPKVFGILSNCDCVFCLECIRDWRKEGLNVAKSSEQVRRCPLCTKETYFICPSPKYVTRNDKDELITAYKESLLTKECKHYKMGTCPFGSSCFYLHVKDGVVEEKKNRKLFTADKDYPVYSAMKISDFIVEKN